ncbi:hypothetical protein TI05_09225 [Achromatium sp. WMS3]|nr:hypothetical protein TI05_09225 [Achromatium sp. WMS3]
MFYYNIKRKITINASWIAIIVMLFLVTGCSPIIIKEIIKEQCPKQEPCPKQKPCPEPKSCPKCKSDTSGGRSNACRSLYEIYSKCYGAGIGKTSRFCANLSIKLYEGLDIEDEEMKKKLSLYCGMSCNEAAKKNIKQPFSDFRRQYCNKDR